MNLEALRAVLFNTFAIGFEFHYCGTKIETDVSNIIFFEQTKQTNY